MGLLVKTSYSKKSHANKQRLETVEGKIAILFPLAIFFILKRDYVTSIDSEQVRILTEPVRIAF
jgi:hypothetical protein